MTGGGLFVGASADATYHAVRTAVIAADNTDNVVNSYSTGVDDETEESVALLFNATNSITGGGTYVVTSDYHDDGAGPELTSLTISRDDSNTLTSQAWGERSGVAFANNSVATEATADFRSYPTDPAPLTNPEGLSRSVAYRGFVVPSQLFYVQQPSAVPLPTTPPRPRVPDVQGWYNEQIRRIGEDAEKKVTTDIYVVGELRRQIEEDPRRGGGAAFSSGQFRCTSPQAFAIGVGRSRELERAQAIREEQLRMTYAQVELPPGGTVANLTYAFDQANANPRSGRIAVQYVIEFNFRVVTRDGRTLTASGREGIRGSLLLEQEWAKTIGLQP